MRRNDSLTRIPGPWFRAAKAISPESLASLTYRAAASQSGLEPLEAGTLRTERSQHVMGLYRRTELLAASHRTLEAIRTAIPSDTTRARFDRIFRPRGEWIVDLHDAALAWARSRVSMLQWGSARQALTAAHLAGNDGLADPEALPRALYGLAVLAANDSLAFAEARSRLQQADPASVTAALTLLQGYTEGRQWYADAVGFFLLEPWIPHGTGQSIRDYVRAEWNGAFQIKIDMPVPQIETRWFGYPQAVPRYGVPQALFRYLINTDNQRASEWLHQHGERSLLRSLRRLPPGDTSLALLWTGSETLRLTTVSRQARESLNGFLEPQDVIDIDPAYSPLLALGTIVHEWQHLVFRRLQLENLARSLSGKAHQEIRLPGVQPHLAEGFAEWSAERILAPVVARWPLLALGELEKRADLMQRDADDHHAIGYALVRALAAALPDPASTTNLLVRSAEHPSRVSTHPALRRAWRHYRGAPDQVLRAPAYRLLIPEVTFTIEDGFPDVVGTRILAPATHDASH